MKNIKLALVFILAGLSLLWWWADPLVVEGNTFFAVRSIAVNYSGVLAMGVMSIFRSSCV